MKTILAIALLLSTAGAECKNRVGASTLTKHVKSMSVATLDKTLPAERFERWLPFGPARIEKLEYFPGECDLKPTAKSRKEGGRCV